MKKRLLPLRRAVWPICLLSLFIYSSTLQAQSKEAIVQPTVSQTTTTQARVATTTAIAPDQPFSMILMSDTQLPWWRGAHDPDCKSDACVEQQAKRTNLNMLTSVNAIGNMGAWPTGATRKNDIARLTQQPSGVIINGDLTAYFHPYQFDMYKEFWDAGRTSRPIYPGLGNHDYSNNTPEDPNCSVNCTGGTYGLYYPDYWRNAKEAVWYMANKITDGSIPNIVNRDLGGYVSLHNVAAFNARMTVAYLLNGQLISRTSDGFESGQWRAFPVPRGATQVSMTIERNNGIRWVTVGSSTNLPVTRNCFKVQGNDSFTSDDCRREWPTGSEGSLSYSFDINNYHFVQLHLEPSYEKDMIERPLGNLTVAAYNPGKSPGFKITKSIAWLKADLDNATAQGKRIVLNMHTDGVGYFGDSTQRAANETAFYDAIAYQNVVAVFSGHLHEQYGYEYASNNSGRNNNIQWFRTGSAECERFLYAEFHDSYFNIGVIKTEGGMPVFVTNPNDICSMTGANYSNPIDRTVRWLRTELVTSHPVSQTFCTGLAARFSARTTADATRFQWQLDANTGRFEDIAATDTRFSGITSATLTITNVTNALAGFRFRIRVQNEAGTLSTSDAATLSIKPTPSTLSIVAQPPGSLAACTGGRTTVSVSVSGGSSENSYQWYRNNVAVTNITSATTAALSLTNLQTANAGSYQVVVQVPNCPISVTSSVFSLSVTTTPARVYVNDDAAGANTGQNWANAYRDLQSALLACPAGEVWVARGLYRPTNTTDRLVSFVVPSGMTIYGGFAGNETLLSQRNMSANPTVLSGDIDNNDIDRFGVDYLDRAADIRGNNSRHVVTLASSTTAQSRLDGLIITAGKAEAAQGIDNANQSGAGIYTQASSSTLANCWITGNLAFNGAGFYTDSPQAFPILINCNFTGNSATNGGAIASWKPTMINCTIYNNQATDTGGGIYVGNGLSLQNTIVWNNTATTSPGIFGSFTATYSDIQNFTPTGSGNISVDPQLNTSIGAHVPVPCSPVVNTGNPATSTALVGAFDIRGLARVVGGRIDMGAYEASNPAGITQQPASGTVVCAGSTVTVSVVATGGTFQYQWYRNGIALTGIASATTATLTIPNVQTANVGSYSVVVTATCGSFTSTPFNLSLSTPIVMDATPYSFSACAGLAITLLRSVTGTVSSYQWYQNGTAIAGATSVTLGILNAQPTNSGSYVLVATGVCNSVTSAVSNLTITPGAKLYVNASASGTNTGTSWANAYRSLQSALQDPLLATCSATEIWVARGVYKPTTTSDRTISFSIRNGVAVYGGFAGTETTISQRNLAQNPTVLSGDIDNNDTNTDGNNVAESYTAIQGSNSYHVVTVTDNAQVRLDGLIITAGQSNGTSVHLQGGGLYTYSANGLLLANCRFQGNTSTDGGGLYTFASNLTVVNSSFAGNQAGYGAAILHRNGTTNLINCSFGNNRATASGGGLYTNTGSFSITNSIIWGNTAPTSPNISGSFTATYSDIQSLTTGTGNIQSDPLFVDAATGNLALQANSPVINLGNPATTTAQVGNTDLNSNPRFVNTRIDMGAYEFQGSSGPIFTVKTGNWNDPTVWSVGYVPGAGDAVELRHVITIPASYLATCLRMTFATGGRLTYGLTSKLRLGF